MLCSGKLAYELMEARDAAGDKTTEIVRIEQLYPFPDRDLRPVLDRYPNLGQPFWVQEEPENMGAWEYLRPQLEKSIEGRWPLTYIGRPRNASPAEGSLARHSANQKALVQQAFEPETNVDRGAVLVLRTGGG